MTHTAPIVTKITAWVVQFGIHEGQLTDHFGGNAQRYRIHQIMLPHNQLRQLRPVQIGKIGQKSAERLPQIVLLLPFLGKVPRFKRNRCKPRRHKNRRQHRRKFLATVEQHSQPGGNYRAPTGDFRRSALFLEIALCFNSQFNNRAKLVNEIFRRLGI